MSTSKSGAGAKVSEEQFRAKRAWAEHEIELQERTEHTARLRALRLAKEAADRVGDRESNPTEPDD